MNTMKKIKVGDRVQSPDPEDDGAQGVVLKVTPSGGLHVEWSDGQCSWCDSDGIILITPAAD